MFSHCLSRLKGELGMSHFPTHPNRQVRARRGYLLLDVVVALSLLAVAIGLGAMVVAQVFTERQHLLHQTIAHQALENTISTLETMGPAPVTQAGLDDLSLETWAAEQLPRSELEATVGPVDALGMQRFELAIVWQERSRQHRHEVVFWKDVGRQESREQLP